MTAMTAWVAKLERVVDRVAGVRVPAWAWPAVMLATGVLVVAVSLVFAPAAHEHVTLLGRPWGEVCAFYTAAGKPCPQCGMTRSWVNAARLHWETAFFYNPAGFTLWLWLVVSGAIGGIRLATRRWDALSPPHRLLTAWVVVWLVGLYAVPWFGRVGLGINPLPTSPEADAAIERAHERMDALRTGG